jgi:hypothetical protein
MMTQFTCLALSMMYDDAIHLFMSGNVPVGEEENEESLIFSALNNTNVHTWFIYGHVNIHYMYDAVFVGLFVCSEISAAVRLNCESDALLSID